MCQYINETWHACISPVFNLSASKELKQSNCNNYITANKSLFSRKIFSNSSIKTSRLGVWWNLNFPRENLQNNLIFDFNLIASHSIAIKANYLFLDIFCFPRISISLPSTGFRQPLLLFIVSSLDVIGKKDRFATALRLSLMVSNTKSLMIFYSEGTFFKRKSSMETVMPYIERKIHFLGIVPWAKNITSTNISKVISIKM